MRKAISIIVVIITILVIFFLKTDYKIFKTGNNMSNKSADKIEKNILNIISYEATVEVTVNSNKNTNIYKLKQQYIKNENIYKQEVIEPDNINGIKICFDGKDLKLENSKLDIAKIYENYPYIIDNNLSLISFINEYVNQENSTYNEEEDRLILKTNVQSNKCNLYKKLYIDKKTNNPIKLEIENVTQKTSIYIKYNEIKINNLKKEDVLAFKLKCINEDI